ncbi:MAG TPA: hypothetical protein VK814_05985 [Acidobacteriaceae bacterium]|nr:hypothetical protein [Acidobacteriaceae bacterium]
MRDAPVEMTGVWWDRKKVNGNGNGQGKGSAKGGWGRKGCGGIHWQSDFGWLVAALGVGSRRPFEF